MFSNLKNPLEIQKGFKKQKRPQASAQNRCNLKFQSQKELRDHYINLF
jgi:hypothetical protein